jgi:hypothetical protein
MFTIVALPMLLWLIVQLVSLNSPKSEFQIVSNELWLSVLFVIAIIADEPELWIAPARSAELRLNAQFVAFRVP